MVSTMHNLSPTTILKQPEGEHEKKPTPCPATTGDYNKWMGLKWWKKVLWRLIDITISNSWITVHSNNPNSEIIGITEAAETQVSQRACSTAYGPQIQSTLSSLST